ncbi:MAG: class I SAM-dependent methyltransferase [Oscillospiraceae bacterium]
MLDERLSLCAEFVSGVGTVCDVGTDHAYLVAELIKSGKCSSAIACDIADGPLDFAKQTVEKNAIEDKVKIIKSDGLDNILPDGITDVVIAGMGGELIRDIILRTEWLKNNVNLVLQPMTKPEVLREALYKNGYFIKEEKCAVDKTHAYSVMSVSFCGEYKEKITLKEKWLGKISDSKLPQNRAYAELFIRKEKKIIDGMKKSEEKGLLKEHEEIAKLFDDFLKGR